MSLERLAVEAPTLPPAELRSHLHRLKGSAGALGFMPLSEAAGRVETELQTDADITASMRSLREELERVLAGLEPWAKAP